MNNNKIYISNELKLLLIIARKEAAFNSNNYLEKCEIHNLIEKGIDWAAFLKSASVHGLIPLVYTAINQINNDKIPLSVIEKLNEEYQIKKVGIAKCSLEVKKLRKLLVRSNIRFFILKGIPLAISIYDKITLRESLDVDLFVHKDDLIRTIKLLSNETYIPLSAEYLDVLNRLNIIDKKTLYEYHHINFFNTKGKVMVELHWKLGKEHFFINTNSIFDFDNLWNNKTEVLIGLDKLYKFSIEDELLYLTYHANTHNYMVLKWLADIYEIVSSYKSIDWLKIINKSKNFGLLRVLAQALVLCSIYFGLDLEDIKEKANDKGLNKVIDSKKVIRNAYYVSRFISFKYNDFYKIKGTFWFNAKNSLYFILYKLYFSNIDKKIHALYHDLKYFMIDIYNKERVS